MDITHHLTIKAKATTIHEAVTTKKGISGWWSMDCQVGETVNTDSTLKFNKEGTIITMGFRTLALDAQKVVWECTENPNPAWIGTKVITEIQPKGDESEVVFSHAGFDEKWKGQDPFEMTKQGWEHFISSLKSYCETGQGQPW